MKYKKIMAILFALICTAAIALGGCSTRSQETGTLHSSVSEQDKNNSSVGMSKDGTESQDPLSGSANTETDANAKNDNANITSDNSDSGKSSENSSSSKASSNSGSGSSASNSSSSKTSGSSGSGKSSGNSNSGSSTSNKTSASHSGSSSSSSSSGTTSKKSAHTHSFKVVSETAATCTSKGVRTYKCSCGQTKTEVIAKALGHKWVKKTHTETTPAKTHTEYAWKSVCNGCGKQFDTPDEALNHIMADFWDNCESYSEKQIPVGTVVDVPASTVKVTDYVYCSRCGVHQ